MRRFLLLVAILVAAVALIAATSVVFARTTYEIVTVDPLGPSDSRSFRNWPLLGIARITPETGRALRERLTVVKNPADWLSCFEPRHGLRSRRGILRTEFLLCFECYRMYVAHGVGPISFGNQHAVLSKDESRAFNDVARAHGLTIATQ